MDALKAAALGVALVGLAAVGVGAVDPAAPAHAAAHDNPLRRLDATLAGVRVTGAVADRIDAGGYAYLHLPEAPVPWIATMGVDAGIGETVSLRLLGEIQDFRSARTGQRFDRLAFGLATAAQP
jgi:hypothetical protein